MLPESPPDSSSESCSPPQLAGTTDTHPTPTDVILLPLVKRLKVFKPLSADCVDYVGKYETDVKQADCKMICVSSAWKPIKHKKTRF